MWVRRLPGWPVSASALFDWLGERITPAHLDAIAESDYGMDADEHREALDRIRRLGLVPDPLDLVPCEVLALYRFGDDHDVDPVAQAWCCVIALLGRDDHFGVEHAVALLVHSCLCVGGEAPKLAEQLFAWFAEVEDPDYIDHPDEPDDGPSPMYVLALLLLHAATEPDDARLPGLAELVTAQLTTYANPLRFGSDAANTRWTGLVTGLLEPLRADRPAFGRLLTALLEPASS